MGFYKKKKFQKIGIGILSTILLITILNLFLTERLECYLKKELVERTTLASDGFYKLSFDKLSISFFKGELRLKGIKLDVDSTIYNQKKANDSLPEMYIKAQIDAIDFNGLNLTWRWSYRTLYFHTFEIKSPHIQLFNPTGFSQAENQPSTKKNMQTLYEAMSPYINVLTVETLNLENASVSYSVNDSISPILYALDDFSFHAYGFRLDSLSSQSGKLLYSNDFNFTTNKTQTLLSNNDFLLKTDSISLSTEDSLIYIENVRLISQKQLWNKKNLRPKNTIDGHIKNIEVNGIWFKRENAQNYLSVDSFNIHSPYLDATNLSGFSSVKTSTNPVNTDSLVQSLSLYELISPILHGVSIDHIGIDHGKLKYTLAVKDSLEIYNLNRFDFHANEIVIDSMSKTGHDLDYFKHIVFNARDIDGLMTARNQHTHVEQLIFDTHKGQLFIKNARIEPIHTQGYSNYLSGKIETINITGLNYHHGLKAKEFAINSIDVEYVKSPDTSILLSIPQILTKELNFRNNEKGEEVSSSSFYLNTPDIRIIKKSKPVKELHLLSKKFEAQNIHWNNSGFDLDWAEIDINYFYSLIDTFKYEQKKDTTKLIVYGLHVDRDWKTFKMNDIRFSTKNISLPIDNGFYTLSIGSIDLGKSNLYLSDFSLTSNYPKDEFAYRHPKHTDWFDVKVKQLELKEIDVPAYFDKKTIRLKEAIVTDAVLQNYKNQQIIVPHRIVPMIYEGIQKAPVKLDIEQLNVNNFTVVYEELAKKGKEPGKLYITDMNGRFYGFTNVASSPEQFIRLDAEGKFMGKGYFTATWMLPVDSLHDQFLLHAHLRSFDLTGLNELITPLALAEIESGYTHDFIFDMDASSEGGTIQMRFPYQDLKVNVFKRKEDEVVKNSFTSFLANTVVRNNNPPHPDDKDSKLREVHTTIVRDPYHSTFNYLWQMLRPALAESVGVSKTEQKVAKGVMKIITGIKNLFHKEKHTEENNVTLDNEQ